MSRAYLYVVDRDFGFAPNPFHGCCTLATCKPVIRRVAAIGDWVIGMGGGSLQATGRCVYAMRVGRTLTYEEYWNDPAYRDKRPVRNGSKTMLVGDNIYHRDSPTSVWLQEDSHHSRSDGSPDLHNVAQDTQTNRVLISDRFYYFGDAAPVVPPQIFQDMGYANNHNHRTFPLAVCGNLLTWLETSYASKRNRLVSDPFNFNRSRARYSGSDNRIYE